MSTAKMLPMSKLDSELTNIINRENDDINLKKKTVESFLSKGLNTMTVNSVFSGERLINTLSDYEKIALIRGIKVMFPNIVPKEENYFSEKTIFAYNNYVDTKEEEILNNIKLENFLRIDDFTYVGVISYEDMTKYIQNNKIVYNINIQREASYVKMGKEYIRVASLDTEAVSSIRQSMSQNTYEDFPIILSVLLSEDYAPEIKFESENDITGVLTCSSLLINDGMHRLSALVAYTNEYYNKHKEYPHKFITAKVVIGDSTRLKRIVKQSFLRSDVSTEYLTSITDDNINKFVQKIAEQSKVLKHNVAGTYEEMKALNKVTTNEVLRDAVTRLGVDTGNIATQAITSKKIANNLDLLIELIKKEIKGNEEQYSWVLSYNLFTSYLMFAYQVIKYNNDLEKFEEFIINLVSDYSEEDLKEFKLGLKIYKKEMLINKFNIFN